MIAAIVPLMAAAMNGFMLGKMVTPSNVPKSVESTDSMMGAKIARAAMAQAIMFMIIHEGRIMRGLGISIKSAPLKPMFNEIALKAKIKNSASIMPILSIVNVGL